MIIQLLQTKALLSLFSFSFDHQWLKYEPKYHSNYRGPTEHFANSKSIPAAIYSLSDGIMNGSQK